METTGLHLSFTSETKKPHYWIKQRALCIHCIKQKCQHTAGSGDQDVDRRAGAVQTTAPLEKGPTRWPLASIHWPGPWRPAGPAGQPGWAQQNPRPCLCVPARSQSSDAVPSPPWARRWAAPHPASGQRARNTALNTRRALNFTDVWHALESTETRLAEADSTSLSNV